MAKYDKYNPYASGTRAKIAAAILATDAFKATAVGINSAGLMVAGAGQTGIIGVHVPPRAMAAGDVTDIMRNGEIVEVAGLAAGTYYYANLTTGALQTGATAVGVGHTVEADRLVVFIQNIGA